MAELITGNLAILEFFGKIVLESYPAEPGVPI